MNGRSRIFRALFVGRSIRTANRSFSRQLIRIPFPKSNAACNQTVPVTLFCFCVAKAASKLDPEVNAICNRADQLYDRAKFQDLYEYLFKYKDSNEGEVLWRLARATYELAQIETDHEKKKSLFFEANDYVNSSIKLDDNNFAAHKWKAILLNYVGEFEGTKVKILNSYEVKHHMERACELNPVDGTSRYLLGVWCFEVADLPWYQRKAASVLFATPPSSSYEESLQHFLKAEDLEPGFYSMNYLMIAKCYIKLNQKEKAKVYLLKARDYPGSSRDDIQAKTDAITMLKSIGVN